MMYQERHAWPLTALWLRVLGSDEHAAKAAGLELLALSKLYQCNEPELFLPLMRYWLGMCLCEPLDVCVCVCMCVCVSARYSCYVTCHTILVAVLAHN